MNKFSKFIVQIVVVKITESPNVPSDFIQVLLKSVVGGVHTLLNVKYG